MDDLKDNSISQAHILQTQQHLYILFLYSKFLPPVFLMILVITNAIIIHQNKS